MDQELNSIQIEFWLTAANCDYQLLTSILRDNPELVDWQDPILKMTALHYAAKFNEISVLKLLAGTYKANTNLANSAGKRPLHIAVEFGSLEFARLLCSTYGGSNTITDYYGHLPIHYANVNNYSKYLPFLGTQKGFNLNFAKHRMVSLGYSERIMIRRAQAKDDLNLSLPAVMPSSPSGNLKKSSSGFNLETISEKKDSSVQQKPFKRLLRK